MIANQNIVWGLALESYIYIYIYEYDITDTMCIYIYVYNSIHRGRQRDRERGGQPDREKGDTCMYVCMLLKLELGSHFLQDVLELA